MLQNNCEDFVVSTVCKLLPGGIDSSDPDLSKSKTRKRKRTGDTDFDELKEMLVLYIETMCKDVEKEEQNLRIRPPPKTSSQEDREMRDRRMRELDCLKERVTKAWDHVIACKELLPSNTYRQEMTKDYKYWMKKYQRKRDEIFGSDSDEEEDGNTDINCDMNFS